MRKFVFLSTCRLLFALSHVKMIVFWWVGAHTKRIKHCIFVSWLCFSSSAFSSSSSSFAGSTAAAASKDHMNCIQSESGNGSDWSYSMVFVVTIICYFGKSWHISVYGVIWYPLLLLLCELFDLFTSWGVFVSHSHAEVVVDVVAVHK